MRKLGRLRTTPRLADIDIATQLDLAGGYISTNPGAPIAFRSLDELLDYWGQIRGEWIDAGRRPLFGQRADEAEPRAETLWRQHRGA